MINPLVKSTLEVWLKNIDQTEDCDTIARMISKRRKEILKADEIKGVEALLESFRSCKPGDTLHLSEPMWEHGKRYERLTFYKWQPRAKRLWVDNPTDTTKIMSLDLYLIKTHNPSRCEAHLRRK